MPEIAEQPPTQLPPAQPRRSPREQTRPKPRIQPPYAVVLHNDPINEMGYVIGVLCKVFRYGAARAAALMLRAHVTGKCIVWTGSLEVAELKADQIRACGPDPKKIKHGAQPLKTTVEPLPE